MGPVKHFPCLPDRVFATSDGYMPVCHHSQVSPSYMRNDLNPHYPPFVSQSSLPTMERSHSRGDSGYPASEDLDRGLGIDFYKVGDHRLLAAWASYFRDHCLQARSDLKTLQTLHDQTLDQLRSRDADRFVKMIDEQGFLESRELQDMFRKKPYTLSSPNNSHPGDLFTVEIGSQFATDCLDSVFEQLATVQDTHQVELFLPFDTPEWRAHLWHCGLKELVRKARMKFCHFYTETIRQSVDVCFTDQKTRKGHEQQLNVARGIRFATEAGNEESAEQGKLMPIYAQVISHLNNSTLELLPVPTDDIITCEKASPLKRRLAEQERLLEALEGKSVRDFFSPEEESFVRLVIRKHLHIKFGVGLADQTDDDEDEEIEFMGSKSENGGLDSFCQQDIAFLHEVSEKCKTQHDHDDSSSGGEFQVGNSLMEITATNNEGSPGKRSRRQANAH